MNSAFDLDAMRYALRLAERHVGNTGSNPSVGCVIVKENQVVSTGVTAIGGRPHAETIALDKAEERAKGATLYVTLEPCAHTGKTPPCVDAIIKAGIARVIIACKDSDPRVAGQSIQKLKYANIEAEVGLCEAEARAINAGFFSRIEKNKPYISMKLATTLDGKIANENGESQWITGDLARRYGHLLRSKNDAIITGIGTATADDPSLTCRIAGLENRSPIRVVLDSKLALSPNNELVKTADQIPTWIITDKKNDTSAFADSGAECIAVSSDDNYINLESLLTILAERGINRLLIEAGAGLSTAFLKQNLVDELYWFTNPSVIGNGGLAAIGELAIVAPSALARMQKESTISLGDDICNLYRIPH